MRMLLWLLTPSPGDGLWFMRICRLLPLRFPIS